MEKEKVLAVVDGVEITGEDFNDMLAQIDPQVAQYFMMGGHEEELIDELVHQQLLLMDAKENGLDKEEEFQKVLKKTEDSLLKTYAIGKLLENVKASEKEVEEFYNKNAEKYDTPAGVHASHILVDSEEKANEIYEELQNGADFAELAVANSSCPSSQQGGDLGVFQKGQMVPEFDAVVFEMEEGEISKPVKTQFGYHVIKLLNKVDAEKHTLSEVKDQVEQEVKRFKDQTAYLDKIAELKAKHAIEIIKDKVEEKEDK